MERSSYPLWVATGAALAGVLLGGAAVWVARADRATPMGRGGSPQIEGSTSATRAKAETTLIDSIAATRDTVVNLRFGEGFRGAGVIYDQTGLILTNYHVVEPMLASGPSIDDAPGNAVTVRFANGRELEATPVVADADEDIAVLRLASATDGERFPAATLGMSADLRVGETVFAVGCPVGLEHTVATGIVSALERTDILPNRQLRAIQLDAAINLGNSGGPLFNVRGELVGITTARSRIGEGIGFAIPIDRVRLLLEALKRGEGGRAGVMGAKISARPEIEGALGGLDYSNGVTVTEVVDGPARRAGLEVGDVIVEVRGRRFDELGGGRSGRKALWLHFLDLARALLPGETLALAVVRRGELVPIRVQVEAATPEHQAHYDAAEALGLVLAEDIEEPTVIGVLPTATVAGVRGVARQLVGMRIAAVMGREIDDVEALGEALQDLEAWSRSGRQKTVSITFADPSGRRWSVPGYPLDRPH